MIGFFLRMSSLPVCPFHRGGGGGSGGSSGGLGGWLRNGATYPSLHNFLRSFPESGDGDCGGKRKRRASQRHRWCGYIAMGPGDRNLMPVCICWKIGEAEKKLEFGDRVGFLAWSASPHQASGYMWASSFKVALLSLPAQMFCTTLHLNRCCFWQHFLFDSCVFLRSGNMSLHNRPQEF